MLGTVGTLPAQVWRGQADSLLGLYKQTSNKKEQVDLLSRASLIFLFQKPDTALQLSETALQIAVTSGNDTALATAHTSLSAVYLIKDNNPLTLKYALEAMKIAEKTPLPPDLMASIYRKMGYVYRNQDNNTASINAYKLAIDKRHYADEW